MMHLRSAIAGLICLVLAIGSGGIALARVQPALMDVIEICSGERIITLKLASDDPQKPAHPCPDCVIAGLSILPEPILVPPAPDTRAPGESVQHAAVADHAPPLRSARDPPVDPC
ncbi:MAG: hypothetical protein WAK98_18755 [Gemmobacter sp.]